MRRRGKNTDRYQSYSHRRDQDMDIIFSIVFCDSWLTLPTAKRSEEATIPPMRFTSRRVLVEKQTASGIASNLPTVMPPQNTLMRTNKDAGKEARLTRTKARAKEHFFEDRPEMLRREYRKAIIVLSSPIEATS